MRRSYCVEAVAGPNSTGERAHDLSWLLVTNRLVDCLRASRATWRCAGGKRLAKSIGERRSEAN